MKKASKSILSLILILTICLSLVSCVDRDNDPEGTEKPEITESTKTGAPATKQPAATIEPTAVPRTELNAEEEQIFGIYEAAYEKNASLPDIKTDVKMTMSTNVSISDRTSSQSSKNYSIQTIHDRRSGSPVINYTVDSSLSRDEDALWTDNKWGASADYYVNNDYVYQRKSGDKDYTIIDRETEEGSELTPDLIYDISTFLLSPETSFVDASMYDGKEGSKVIALKHYNVGASIIIDGQFAALAAQIGAAGNDFIYRQTFEKYTVDQNGYLSEYTADFECGIDLSFTGYAGECELKGHLEITIVDPGTVFDLKIPDNIYYPPGFVGKETDEELYALYLAAQEKTADLKDVHYILLERADLRYDLGYEKKNVEERTDAEVRIRDRGSDGVAIHMTGATEKDAGSYDFDFYADSDFYYIADGNSGEYAVKSIDAYADSEYSHYLSLDGVFTAIYPREVFRGATIQESNDESRNWHKRIEAVPRDDVIDIVFGAYISEVTESLEEQFDAKEITYRIDQRSLSYTVDPEGFFASGGGNIILYFEWYSNNLTMSLVADYAVYVKIVEPGVQVEVVLPE